MFSINFSFTDGELEAEWLVAAGFPQLTKAFQEVFIPHLFHTRFIRRICCFNFD